MKRVYLLLTDGSLYCGSGFGAQPPTAAELDDSLSAPAAGEVVFNTSMSGYHEIITDPSYTGQIVLMTYPHIGNYGTDSAWNENGPGPDDRSPLSIRGLIVRECYNGPLPPERTSLADLMLRWNVPGITGIDTRRLTLSLRDEGSRNGVILRAAGEALTDAERQAALDWLCEQPEMTGQNLIGEVGTSAACTLEPDLTALPKSEEREPRPHFVLLDCGLKNSIARELVRRGTRITLLPAGATAAEVLACRPDGLLVSNGPGDPAVLDHQVGMIRECIGTIPVFGICLGHQLIALALGARTYKMKFGHHGGNHPVRDEYTGKVCVTSQNHGFAVDGATLPPEVDIWFTNANDGSIEGIAHTRLPVRAVQFHPEAAPGPHDARWIFDSFIELSRSRKPEAGRPDKQVEIES